MKITSIENWKLADAEDMIFKKDYLSLTQEEVEQRLKENLEFGTAGIRGIMGFGTNRMNEYTVAAAAQAYAQFLLSYNKESAKMGVVVAHDNRHNNVLFSEVAARVLMANGIKVHLFESNKLQSTPFTSYTIRRNKLAGAVIITASHNPKEYNGFKVYNEHGGQLMPEFTKQIQKFMETIDPLTVTRYDGILNYYDSSLHDQYLNELFDLTLNKTLNLNVTVAYSPQHGAGLVTAPKLFRKLNIKYDLVESQMTADPDFSNTITPNPESKDSFKALIELGKEKGSDILLTTDPDADRLAIAIKHNDKYVHMDGNQTAALYAFYKFKMLHEKHTIPMNGYIVKSVVSGNLPGKIAAKYSMPVYETHVGFKNIAHLIEEYENSQFLFGYEESYGSLINADMARDKDSFQLMVGIIEMASHYKALSKTLVDVYDEIEAEFGKYESGNTSQVMTSEDQNKKLDAMAKLKWDDIESIEDYRKGFNGLEAQNLVKVILTDGSWFALRPSGTEPKVKMYAEAVNNKEFLKRIKEFMQG